MTTPGRGDGSGGDPNSNAVITAVASFGLAGSRLAWPARTMGDEAWHAVLSGCARQHLVGLLGAATAAGAVAVDRRHRGGLDALLTEWRSRAARIERDAVELSARLARAGIEHRIVDGPITAQRAYDPPSHRLFASVDILVADEAAGREELEDLASGRRLRFTTDLLAGTGRGAAGLGDLPAQPDLTVVSDRRLPSLPIDAQLVAACLALSGERLPALAAMRDIAQVALAGGATVEGVAAWSTRWRVTDGVAAAIRRSWATLDLADAIGLSVWAGRHEPPSKGRPRPPFLGSLRSRWRSQTTNVPAGGG